MMKISHVCVCSGLSSDLMCYTSAFKEKCWCADVWVSLCLAMKLLDDFNYKKKNI